MITYEFREPPPYIPGNYRDGMRGIGGGIFRGDLGGLGGIMPLAFVSWDDITRMLRASEPFNAANSAISQAEMWGAPAVTRSDWYARLTVAHATNNVPLAQQVFDEAYAWGPFSTAKAAAKNAWDGVNKAVKNVEVPLWLKAAGVVAAIGVVGYTVRAFR